MTESVDIKVILNWGLVTPAVNFKCQTEQEIHVHQWLASLQLQLAFSLAEIKVMQRLLQADVAALGSNSANVANTFR